MTKPPPPPKAGFRPQGTGVLASIASGAGAPPTPVIKPPVKKRELPNIPTLKPEQIEWMTAKAGEYHTRMSDVEKGQKKAQEELYSVDKDYRFNWCKHLIANHLAKHPEVQNLAYETAVQLAEKKLQTFSQKVDDELLVHAWMVITRYLGFSASENKGGTGFGENPK